MIAHQGSTPLAADTSDLTTERKHTHMDRKYKLMLVTDDHELLESWNISTNRQTEDADVDVTYPVPNYSALMVADEINTAIKRHGERQDNTLAKNAPRVLGGFTKSIGE